MEIIILMFFILLAIYAPNVIREIGASIYRIVYEVKDGYKKEKEKYNSD